MSKFLFALFIIWNSIPSHSQSIDKETKGQVRQVANELLRNSNMPGISVAISKNGKIVFAEGFGYADIEGKIPVTTETQFRTASIAKIITATAIAKLVQEGKLNLSLPVQEYVPSFPTKPFAITSLQLAGHLSGLPHYSQADRVENRTYKSIKEALGVFSHEDLIAEPGTKYSYSTHGYTLLSAVIEGASGTEYLEYMKKEIFDPLNMSSTKPDKRNTEPNSKAAKLYIVKNDVVEEVKNPEDVSYKWAGGGFVSTPTDLINLSKGYSNGFIKDGVVRMMFESQQLKSGEKTQVGIGWRISQDIDGRKVIEHAGSMQGARSVICMYPNEGLTISIMVNAEWASTIEETAHMMARPFLVKTSPKKIPQGKFNISVTTVNGRGEETTTMGELTLVGNEGKVSLETGTKLSILYLRKDNIYALIRPDGIYYLTIDFDGQSLSGKAIAYGTRLSECPINNPPFVKFSSK